MGRCRHEPQLQAANPELNAGPAQESAQARFAYQDAQTNRAQARRDLGTTVKTSAHTKSLAALGGVGSVGSGGADALTDLGTMGSILVGLGLPAAYAVVDKFLNRNRDPQAPKPVRDAYKAYKDASSTERTTRDQLKTADQALTNSFKPPQKQVGPSRGR